MTTRRTKTLACLVSLVALSGLAAGALELQSHLNARSEADAIETLHRINAAQARFREEGMAGKGKLRYGSLPELVDAGLLEEELRSGTRQGYRFEVHPSPTTADFLWCASASPVKPSSARRHFIRNHTGVTGLLSKGPEAPQVDCGLPDTAQVTSMSGDPF